MDKLFRYAALSVIALLVIVLVLGLWFTVLFIKPKRTVVERTPTDFSLMFEDVTLTSHDGVRLVGWYIPPPPDGDAVVIYLHGRSSNRAHFLEYAAALHDTGYGAFLFDMRAHGESEGGELTYGILEVGDVRVVSEYLQHERQVDRVAIAGHSLGASLAIQAAAEIEDLSAIIAFSPYSSITEVIGDRAWQNRRIPPRPTRDLIITFVGVLTQRDYTQACPKCVIVDIAQRPVLHVHGTADVEVPFWSAGRILDSVGSGDHVTYWQLEGVDHMSHEWVAENRMDEVITFLEDALN